ncbi:MAG: glycosyltransferase [Verrucomicrobiales bacterium]|nr:glycosyltransferase [Verrucomicrobiales bacterium]
MKFQELTIEETDRLIAGNTEVIKDEAFDAVEPLVSIACIAFNHGKFLEEALDGVLKQKIDFPIEILIGEDDSTDDTLEIAKRYQARYPDQIQILRSTRNLGQYTRSGRLNFLRALRSCRGKYVAVLEGDDFWSDPDKLSRQVSYLEKHPDASGCFTDCDIVDEDGKVIEPRPLWNKPYQESYTQPECLADLGSAYGTATLLFRRIVMDKGLPEYFVLAGSDFLLDLAITEYGTLNYLPGTTAAYRIHSGGLWQGTDTDTNAAVQLRRMEELWNRSRLPESVPDELSSVHARIATRLGRWICENRGGEATSKESSFELEMPTSSLFERKRWEVPALMLFLSGKWNKEARIVLPVGDEQEFVWLEIAKQKGGRIQMQKLERDDVPLSADTVVSGGKPMPLEGAELEMAIQLLAEAVRLSDMSRKRAKRARKRANKFKRKYEGLLRSRTYRLGSFLLKPVRLIANLGGRSGSERGD